MNGVEGPETAPGGPRRRAKRAAAWTAIILCLAGTGLMRGLSPSSRVAVAGAEVHGALGADIAARYAVGAFRRTSMASAAEERPGIMKPLFDQIDRAARRPEDKLRAAVLAAELIGEEEARRRLAALSPSDGTEPGLDVRLLETLYHNGVREGLRGLNDTAQERIVKKLGWTGRLALTQGLPDADPARAALLRQAFRTFVGGVAAILAGLVVLGAGSILAVPAVLRWRAGRLPRAFVPPSAMRGADPEMAEFLLEAFAIYLVWYVAMGPIGFWISGSRWPWFWRAVAALGPVWCLWPLLRGVPFGDLRRSLGWTRGAGVLREMGWGIVGYAAGAPLIALGMVATYLLSIAVDAQPSHPVMDGIVWDPPRLAAVLALTAVYAPIAEETMFRGALYAGVRGRRGVVAGGALVAFVFAALHPQGWTAIPALMAIAAVLGLLREWRGSSIAPMTAHALNNGAVTIIFALLAG